MPARSSRRSFLRSTGGAAFVGGGLAGMVGCPVDAADLEVTPDLVRLRPEIAPLVDALERTPRERCPAFLADRLRAGVPYRELLAAAFLYAVGRQGHHEVYLVHAAYRMSQEARPEDRLLPLFWAVDVIKEHLVRFEAERVPPLAGKLPGPERAVRDFEEGMRNWDRERAERAVIALARAVGGRRAMERLWHFGARDWSFIGHLPIAVANTYRTLETIGWQHAEPVLRYVVRELFVRNTGQTKGQPYEANVGRVRQRFADLPAGWAGDAAEREPTLELLDLMRAGRWDPACAWTLQQLLGGKVRAGTIWDAVHLAAGEMMVRFSLGAIRLGNRALHSNTCSNALHYAFRTCADAQDRLLILLQAVAWVTAFIANEAGRSMLRKLSITAIPEEKLPATGAEAIEAIFASLPRRRFREEIKDRSGQDRACRLTFALASKDPVAADFLRTARHQVCRKATLNSHDVKLPMAMFEDLAWVSPRWRPHLLAAAVHFLHGTAMEDNPVVRTAREALAGR